MNHLRLKQSSRNFQNHQRFSQIHAFTKYSLVLGGVALVTTLIEITELVHYRSNTNYVRIMNTSQS